MSENTTESREDYEIRKLHEKHFPRARRRREQRIHNLSPNQQATNLIELLIKLGYAASQETPARPPTKKEFLDDAVDYATPMFISWFMRNETVAKMLV